MTLTVGIDSVEIARIARSMQRPRFLERNFSKSERAYFAAHALRAETVAGCFCAKEAFSKALGTGVRDFELHEVAVEHTELGAPYLAFTGQAAALARGRSFALSITHTETTATAIVTAFCE